MQEESKKYKKEIDKLEKENQELKEENRSVTYRLNKIFIFLKQFLRKLLLLGNDNTKDETSNIVKNYYDKKDFNMKDVVNISKGTTKQDDLFDYVNAPDYYKEKVRDYIKDKYDKEHSILSK